MRVTKHIDATVDEIESAKETAVALMQDNSTFDYMDLFFNDDLEYIEAGIKKLNDFSDKSWLLSAILLYTLIFNKQLYTQSGLTWSEYSKEARTRIGLDNRDITDQLSAARFFILHHKELERKGFDPVGNNRKLARAELATTLCHNSHQVVEHLCNDTWQEFNEWYSSYKPRKTKWDDIKNDEIEFIDSKIIIKGKTAVTFSKSIPEDYKERLEKYFDQIVTAIRQGYEPAIVPVYDEKEAKVLTNLRDKYRQKK